MRVLVLSAVIALGAVSMTWRLVEAQGAPAAAPPAGPPTTTLNPANFTGKVTPNPMSDFRVTRYTFDPAARTNWHSHEGGQVIVIEKGRMRAQEKGGTGKEFGPRQTYVVAAGTTHWHGALPGEPLTQVALSYGTTNWMAPVTDAEYKAAAQK